MTPQVEIPKPAKSLHEEAMANELKEMGEQVHLLQQQLAAFQQAETDWKRRIEELRFQSSEDKKLTEELRDKISGIENTGEERLRQLQEEKKTILSQLESKNTAVESFKVDLQQAKAQSLLDIGEANKKIDMLQKQLERLQAQKNEESDLRLQSALANFEQIRKERDEWIKERSVCEASINRLKQFNDQLTEQEKILHYELTKSQAQIIGLEKVCEDFKGQIETIYQHRQ